MSLHYLVELGLELGGQAAIGMAVALALVAVHSTVVGLASRRDRRGQTTDHPRY
jgi:hypothetical protein